MAWFPTATGHLGTACPPVHVMGNVGTTIAMEAWNNHPIPGKFTLHYCVII